MNRRNHFSRFFDESFRFIDFSSASELSVGMHCNWYGFELKSRPQLDPSCPYLKAIIHSL
jgi:hypothetical protein